MGLLKLSSLYKKSKKKEKKTPPPTISTTPKLEPIPLQLSLGAKEPLIKQPQKEQPAGPGSLFDDIFSELNITSPVTQEGTIENDFSLALALSQQLSMEENSTKKMTETTKTSNTIEQSTTNNAKSLFTEDSIYSSYLRNMSAIESPNDDSIFSASMFDSMINRTTSSSTPIYRQGTLTFPTTTSTTTTAVTQAVLDSDISDSDEESKHSESEEEVEFSNQDSKRMTKGVQPIMERRGPNLFVQRKIDTWSNRLDTGGDVNESVIERMKDRHRVQVKLAAQRNQIQQQLHHPQLQPQYDYTMQSNNNSMLFGNQHMVPQAYITPTVPLSQNIVLPHPGVLVDPAQIYYPPPINQEIMSPLPNQRTRIDSQNISTDRSSSSPHESSSTLPSENELSHREETAADADAETSDDEQERKSKQRSTKKMRSKTGEEESWRIRSSRSTPNLKKKQKSSKSNSRTSSRRGSQDFTSSPSSEMIKTPPPLPQDFYQPVSPKPNNHHRIRHMKSEPEISARLSAQHQQQLTSGWERMQNFQREQQLKYQQQMSMMYSPFYYSTIPSYSGSNDHQSTSQMGMLYKQQQQQQQHQSYYPSR